MTDIPLSKRRPIHGVAVDQGSGLAAALREARGAAARDDDLFLFKQLVARTMSTEATTLLVDAQYGRALLPEIATSCLPMLAFEADVYKIVNDDRITVLPDNLQVADYPALGVDVLKFFLYYGPNDDPRINDRKHKLVQQIGEQCREHGISFLFEPIVYDRAIPDSASAEFADRKPDLVARATRIFAQPEFNIAILKVELPVNLDFVEGIGTARMSRNDAEAAFRNAAEAAGDVPLLYLSAGVTFEQFEAGLKLARAAGVNMAGFMCGRAIWSDAIAVFGAEGPEAAERWMADEGLRRLRLLGEALA
ncbi:tagatose 1,6-diphosphate aldolase [Paracoccus sp. Z330]|uniref:Tagatose 1,6-diphosphate aldolase n=1 Tax=Paracoccus onchidii TaxID=3017813 RepID=A0ABT4ZG93_9RHOB|nr:tagatose 1,6-diphosphate aldolase [Paracoccus onchidii]MDB6177736.1 tagatose 1,6-diphosphate aldolase [Paracoccus onchidii]